MPKLINSFNSINLIYAIMNDTPLDELMAIYSFYMFDDDDFEATINNYGTCDEFKCSVTNDRMRGIKRITWTWSVAPFDPVIDPSIELIGTHTYFDNTSGQNALRYDEHEHQIDNDDNIDHDVLFNLVQGLLYPY